MLIDYKLGGGISQATDGYLSGNGVVIAASGYLEIDVSNEPQLIRGGGNPTRRKNKKKKVEVEIISKKFLQSDDRELEIIIEKCFKFTI